MVDDRTLMAYADGELGARARAEVEAAIAADAGAAGRLGAHRDLRRRAREAYDDVLDEAPPAHLVALILDAQQDAHRAPSRRTNWVAPVGLAASLVVGVLVGTALQPEPSLRAGDAGLQAGGRLAVALDRQLSTDRGEAVEIGLSFARSDGIYCRTFRLPAESLAGMACREAGRWAVPVTAASPAQAQTDFMTASTPLPAPVLDAVDAALAGESLDATQERQARDRDWRR